jgi:hypothetical protein
MRARIHIRRDQICPWKDFWHRVRVGAIVAALIAALPYILARC